MQSLIWICYIVAEQFYNVTICSASVVCFFVLFFLILRTGLWKGVLRIGTGGGGAGATECNLTGRCPFFKNLHNPFRKKICISIPCFGIIRLQKIPKTIGKTIVYCSWTNSDNLYRNFWSIFMPGSGIYAEKWYPEKRHVPYRFMWKCPSGLELR